MVSQQCVQNNGKINYSKWVTVTHTRVTHKSQVLSIHPSYLAESATRREIFRKNKGKWHTWHSKITQKINFKHFWINVFFVTTSNLADEWFSKKTVQCTVVYPWIHKEGDESCKSHLLNYSFVGKPKRRLKTRFETQKNFALLYFNLKILKEVFKLK